MRIIKYIFLLILLFSIAITVFVATQKSEFKVQRSYIIKVPKSVVFVGTNNSIYACDYYVFLEYSARMSLSIISGSRVA